MKNKYWSFRITSLTIIEKYIWVLVISLGFEGMFIILNLGRQVVQEFDEQN